ncbi:MAG: alpha/beta fold hydrolase [Pseudomonadota bacterium]
MNYLFSKKFLILAVLCSFHLLVSCSSKTGLVPVEYGVVQTVNRACPSDMPHTGDDQCQLYEVPLNWSERNGETIDVFLRTFKRDEGNSDTSKGQIWVIDGGPGASGSTFSDPKFVELIHDTGWDLYIPTHRGVGFSTALDCGLQLKAFDAVFVKNCSRNLVKKYGDNLNWFSSIGAAHDLNYLIAANNPNKVPVILMGTSYGTLVAQRFVQQFEQAIDGVILVSGTQISPAFENVSEHQEDTFKRILAHCDLQQDCADMFNVSAYDVAKALILDDGWQQCEITQSNPVIASQILGFLASNSKLRDDLPLTLKRLTRCNAEDVEMLKLTTAEIGKLMQKQYEQLFQFNPIALHHQIFTEMLSSDQDALDQFQSPKTKLLGDSVMPYIDNSRAWPSRKLPLNLPSQINTELPILVLHGGLDIQAHVSWFNTLSSQLNGTAHHAILFEDAGHGTPNYTELNNGINCSWQLVESFLNNEDKTNLDTSCVEKVTPLRFNVQ